MRNPNLEQPDGHGLGSVREQMQIDVAVIRGGAGKHRPHQPRFEFAQHAHRVEGDAALLPQRMVVRIAVEQALVLAQGRLDFHVFRQHGDIVDAQPVGRLALGLQEILDAVLGHDPRRFLGEGAAQVLCTLRKLLGHGP